MRFNWPPQKSLSLRNPSRKHPASSWEAWWRDLKQDLLFPTTCWNQVSFCSPTVPQSWSNPKKLFFPPHDSQAKLTSYCLNWVFLWAQITRDIVRRERIAVLMLADPRVLEWLVEAVMPRDKLATGSWLCWVNRCCFNFPFEESFLLNRTYNLCLRGFLGCSINILNQQK